MEDLTQAAPPCRIHTKTNGIFVVPDVNAWQGQDDGIFAIGHWLADGEWNEWTVLIPHREIAFVQYDFAALRAWQAVQLQPPDPDEEELIVEEAA